MTLGKFGVGLPFVLLSNHMARPINLVGILSKYKKGWVALSADNRKLVATGSSLKQVLDIAESKGISNPTIFKPAPVKNFFVG